MSESVVILKTLGFLPSTKKEMQELMEWVEVLKFLLEEEET